MGLSLLTCTSLRKDLRRAVCARWLRNLMELEDFYQEEVKNWKTVGWLQRALTGMWFWPKRALLGIHAQQRPLPFAILKRKSLRIILEKDLNENVQGLSHLALNKFDLSLDLCKFSDIEEYTVNNFNLTLKNEDNYRILNWATSWIPSYEVKSGFSPLCDPTERLIFNEFMILYWRIQSPPDRHRSECPCRSGQSTLIWRGHRTAIGLDLEYQAFRGCLTAVTCFTCCSSSLILITHSFSPSQIIASTSCFNLI